MAARLTEMTNRHVIAWAGFSLVVPVEWNLSVAHGDTDSGTIALTDLHMGQLEVRWRSGRPRGLARQLRRLVGKNAPVEDDGIGGSRARVGLED